MTAATEPPSSVNPVSRSAPGRPAPARLGAILNLLARVTALVAIFITFGLIVPDGAFFRPNNIENICIQSAVYAMAGLGMTMIIITGGIDLAAGSTIALSMVVTAKVLMITGENGALAHHPAFWTLIAVASGAASASLVGLLEGVLITGLRLVPFIVTLGAMQAIRGLAKGFVDNKEISPPDFNWLYRHLLYPVQGRQFSWQLVPLGVWGTLLAALLAAGMLRYTKLGRHVYAIGSSEATARLCGVPVVRTKILVYLIAGIFTGLAGVLEFSKLNMGQPTGAQSYELFVIAACVIGGTSLVGGVGTISGTIIGALIIGTLNAGTNQAGWEKWIQEICNGAIIIVAVALDQLRLRRYRT